MRFGPVFSSAVFSTPAIWSYVFQSRMRMEEDFVASAPLVRVDGATLLIGIMTLTNSVHGKLTTRLTKYSVGKFQIGTTLKSKKH